MKGDETEKAGNEKRMAMIAFALIFAIFAAGMAFAIPDTLTLQGKLTSQSGAAQSGIYNFSFKIYDAFTGGNTLYTKHDTNVTTDVNGIYDIILDGLSALNFTDQYYLGITVGDDNESTPRVNLTNAPYAFRANVSEQLNPANRYRVTDINITGTFSANDTLFVREAKVGIGTIIPSRVLEVIGDVHINLSDSDYNFGIFDTNGIARLFINNSNGNIGINTSKPAHTLTVQGTLNVTANTSSGVNLFVASSGSVGIGTATPISALTVIGDVSTFGSLNATFINATQIFMSGNLVQTGESAFKLGNVSNYTQYIRSSDFNLGNISNESTGNVTTINQLFNDAGFTSFNLGNVSNYTQYIRSSDFNLGNISNESAGNVTSINQLFNDAGFTSFNLGNVSNYTQYIRSSDFNLGNISNNTLKGGDNITLALWNASGNDIFLREITGNVGIGAIKPDSLLTIFGNEITAGAILHLNVTDSFNTTVMNIMTLDHVLKNPVNSTGGIGVSILFRASDNASQLANIGNISAILYNATNGSQLSALTFSTRGADTGDESFGHLLERMRIDGNGRIGIGVTKPREKLEVAGNIYVNNTVNAFINLSGPSLMKSGNDIVITD